ncbi:Calpain-type cysteine protease DEK1 [Zea mays]|uniref:Protein DEFECTIVE KERNEL 1 n=1 Tax=Zea mays TaxID=4577 RepID=A0A1D6JZW0_MAIZE|nr:Calpain-type cysteine protease DEK1 [Zea mays]
MEGEGHHGVVLACSICGFLFAVLSPFSFWVLWAVNWRPWRLYSWIYARKWPTYVQGPQLSTLCSLLTLCAWLVVISPIAVLLVWGSVLIALMERNIIGLAVIMAGVALLLSFYSIMLWWRTQWQSSKAVAYLLLLAVCLLCAYDFCAIYVTAGASASELNSPSGFFFGVSVISLAINMLFICKILFNVSGFDVDEYVRRSYKFAYSDCVEVAPVSCSPEPPDPSELYMTKSSRVKHLGLLYISSLLVLVGYSILYGLTSKEARWLGALTSVAVVILDWNLGLCSFRFELLKSRMIVLFVAGTSRAFLVSFGVHYWYLGHCISYAFVASVLLSAAVSSWLSISNPSVARIDALRSTVIKLREGFRRKGQNSSSNSSEGCGSSVKRSSGSVEAGQNGNAMDSMYRSNSQSDGVNWSSIPFDRSNSCQEGRSSDKNIDSARASLAHRSNSCLSAVQDSETAVVSVDRHGDPITSLVCSSSGLESHGCEPSGSATTSGNQQLLDLNLAAIFQDRLNDPRISSMLKKNGGLGDVELANLLQDKGLDPNFSYMLKDKVMDPRILALLQRSSLDADREHQDDVDVTATDSDRLDTTIANQISLSEELRRSGLEKWLNISRLIFHHLAGSPIRAFIVFTVMFIIETATVAIYRPETIKVINATHEQFEFGFSILLLSPVVCSIMAFIWSLRAEEMLMTSKPQKYGFIAWLLSTCVGLFLSFLSKSSVILGLSLTVPLMVACLSFAVPIWIRNGYSFWIPGREFANRENVSQAPGEKERALFVITIAVFTASIIGLGAIVSAKPLDALGYKGWDADKNSSYSPYATSMYLGWALSSTIAVITTGLIPIVAWFATYRFSPSSAICVGLFATVLVSFCGASYWGVVNSREDGVPLKADFLAALLPLLCIPAFFSLFTGLYNPNTGSRDAAAMAAAVRAVGGDSALEDSFARDRVSSIANHIRKAQLARRAEQTGIPGTICILDDEPRSTGRHCGELDLCLCQSQKVTLSIAVMVQPVSGPVCLFGSEFQKVCWEILVAGSEQGMEAGQVGLRLVTKGERMTTVAKEWNIGASSIADGRWHLVTVTLDADLGEATSFIDGVYDGYQNGLPLPTDNGIWEPGTDIWVGARPPMDLDAFGRSDSEGSDSKMQIMDAFLWGRCLSEDEVTVLHTAMSPAEYGFFDLAPGDAWHGSYSARVDDWESEEAYELYDQGDVEWDGQYSSGRKRPVHDAVAIDLDSFARRPRKPRFETRDEVNQRMLSVERAVRDALIAKGERNFTDQEFPPEDRSLFVDPMNPPLKLQVVSEWMRPSDIAKDISISCQPCLFSGSVNSSDVCQGRLGDCWFLSAVAVLTEMSRISEVIITPEYNDEGIYTVRFCIQGEWVAVVVDDWIPCESPGKPAFATSRKQNELWVSILEKAYAKLHGSYEALEGGLVQDALVDLTGGAGEEIDMRSPQAQLDLASGRLWSQLLHFKQEGFLLGAGSPSGSDAHISSSGIVQGHAYSILQVREVDGHKLIQIRNPWANEVEWNGPWSDSSPEWTERMKHKLMHVPQSKNGVFWMSWQDFQIHFRSIYVCRVYPPEMRYSVHGQWRGYNAGGCQDYDSWHQNPQYRLRVTGRDALYPVHVFITLTQGVGFSRKTNGFRNYQSSHDSSMFYIGMRILKTQGCRAAYNIYMHESAGGTDYVNSREISCELVLDPYPKGYTIVPTTIHPGEEAPFVLSVFSKASIRLEAV